MTLNGFISEKGYDECDDDLFPLLKLVLVFMDGEEEETYKDVSQWPYRWYLHHEIRRIEHHVCFDRGGNWDNCDEYFDIFLYAKEDDKDYG